MLNYFTKLLNLYFLKYDCNHTFKKRFTIPSYFQNHIMKLFVYLFLFAIMARPVFPILEYAVNYEHIAKELCENKNKPKSDCNGKCHLKKELAKASENDQPSQGKKSFSNEIFPLFIEDITSFIFKEFRIYSLKIHTFYTNLYSHLDTVLVFHPPIHL